jgi:hypothetical protein
MEILTGSPVQVTLSCPQLQDACRVVIGVSLRWTCHLRSAAATATVA